MKKVSILVEKWKDLPQVEFSDFSLLPREELYKVHDKSHVDGLFKGEVRNGFGNNNPDYAERDLWQVSNFFAAAKESLINRVSCSPTAGFHHATYNYSGMYCIFNGLMLTAVKLHDEMNVKKIGILDLDFHYGDGTDDIIHKLNINYINHWGFAKNWVPSVHLFFLRLQQGLNSMKDCDIILYQAGADMYKHDPNGGILLEEEMRKRDQMVFEWCQKNNKPIVWCLAGGYTPMEKLVSLHDTTMQECLKTLK